MKVDNQTTRNARNAGVITQQQARRLLEAAEATRHTFSCGNLICKTCNQIQFNLFTAIKDITGTKYL